MTTLLPFITAVILGLSVVLFERDEMATHTDSNPPNFGTPLENFGTIPKLYHQRIIESAPFPSARAEPLPPSDTTAYEPPAPPAPSQRVTGASFAEVEQLTEAQMRELAPLAGFTEELIPALLAVTWCESRYSPGAVGGAGEAGLGQIHPVNWRRFDQFADPNPWDPLQNLIVTYQMSQGGTNWWAWSCKP